MTKNVDHAMKKKMKLFLRRRYKNCFKMQIEISMLQNKNITVPRMIFLYYEVYSNLFMRSEHITSYDASHIKKPKMNLYI